MVALLGSALVPGTAEATTGDNDAVLHRLAVSSADQAAVRAYWTAERIAGVPTDPPSDNAPSNKPDGTDWNRGNAGSRTIGRLFFTSRGEDSSCTATVVNSTNHSVVVTGGHCVAEANLIGEDLQWITNPLFIPGYREGHAPYGSFVGRAGVAARGWLEDDGTDSSGSAYDQAFLTLGRNEKGQRVADAVGAAQNIVFDQPAGRLVHEFGYPRSTSDPAREGRPEYTGRRLAACYGRPKQDHGMPDWPSPEGIWGVPCVMGGGSSGGPRITDLNEATGLGNIIGVNIESAYIDDEGNSCDFGSCVRHLVGPQFSTAVTAALHRLAAQF